MTGRLSTVRSLNVGDVGRLWTAAVLLPLFDAAVVGLSFGRLREWLLRATARIAVPGTPRLKRIVWAVTTVDRYLPGERKCLVRSLACETLTRMYGYEPKHRLGVDKDAEDGAKAHSWLEHEGEILIGDLPDLDRYEPLPPLESELRK